ncbi:MAG: ECF transporter S component [Firmicutes bacterium]|nr:ECF transporter S component [Candidatus Colivicinus equi]
MAALCYVAFTFLQIKIPTPAGYTSFHLGNVFCVLGAILIDGVSGGIAGAIGMGIADLFDPAYVLTVPKTVILKFFIGFITGTMAHKVLEIDEKENADKEIFISILIGMLFNVAAEPLLSFFYYDLILNNTDKAASYLTIAKWTTTLVNATLTVVIGSALAIAIRKRFKR